jgi:hypothetical protein
MTSTDSRAIERTAGWHVITGTARGAAHLASGLPNQDAAARQAGPDRAVTVAIADGHGHARHFRSAAGSALAVDVACRAATRVAVRLSEGEAEPTAAVRDELTRAIVTNWRAAVASDLAVRPYTAREQSALDLAGDDREVPYGSTLLVTAISGHWLVCAQIGDGDLLGVCPDGDVFYPVAADDLLDGCRTTSLCQPDAVTSFRTGVHDLRQVPLLVLLHATDGYGNAQAEDPWQPGVGRDLAELAAEHDHHWFEQQVPSWAQRCASADGSGDDVTIALLLRADAATMKQDHARRDS